jgi:hypothetical protein
MSSTKLADGQGEPVLRRDPQDRLESVLRIELCQPRGERPILAGESKETQGALETSMIAGRGEHACATVPRSSLAPCASLLGPSQ